MTLSWSIIKITLCFCDFHRIRVFLLSSIIEYLQLCLALPDLKLPIVHLAPREQVYFPVVLPGRSHHQGHCFFIGFVSDLLPLHSYVVLVARAYSQLRDVAHCVVVHAADQVVLRIPYVNQRG